MTFVIIGAGPTGVELAGAIAALAREFRHIDRTTARIVLVEVGPQLLASFPPELSEAVERAVFPAPTLCSIAPATCSAPRAWAGTRNARR